MTDVTLHKTADHDLFMEACGQIAANNPEFHQVNYLVDVDGSEMAFFQNSTGEHVTVYNDYDVDAIYGKADTLLHLSC